MSAPPVVQPEINGLDNVNPSQAGTSKVIPKKRAQETLAGMVDFPLTDHQKQRADIKLLRVRLEELGRVKKSKRHTFLIDVWEDLLKRSIYGSVAAQVAAQVAEYPSILSLEDMTGSRATADGIMDAAEKALQAMDLADGRNFIAMTTDNPTVMQAVRRKFQAKYFWILTFPCFLHQLNTLIGEILTYPAIKKVITQGTRIITFFNSSHYWGGQLRDEAKNCKVSRGLKKNCESRFYAITLLCGSVLENREPISRVCFRPDAQKKTNGLSPVARDVVTVMLQQLLRFVKPLVDAIGNVEGRNVNLADCMLELLRCSKALSEVKTEPDDDIGFSLHARAVFNHYHSLALFLHPLCHKLAVSTITKARPFEKMVKSALDIAKQWRWTESRARALVENLQQYHQVKGPFVGGHCNSLEWWENLPISGEKYPLKSLAITLLSIVPHAAEVERLFSALGGVQTPQRCNLTISTFETLGKLRANYCYQLYERDRALGKSTHRRHAHMHTQPEAGVNIELVEELKDGFTWEPPLASHTPADNLSGPEDITLDDIDKAFDDLDARLREERANATEAETVEDGQEILEGNIYDLSELDVIDMGQAPVSVSEDLSIIGDAGGIGWDVEAMMAAKGVV
ncbi:ribonuclease H-like domain-containing protein [Pholiota molesta]|nr:ribonuclease H-like domain-containing protein [Pholiota molesta]